VNAGVALSGDALFWTGLRKTRLLTSSRSKVCLRRRPLPSSITSTSEEEQGRGAQSRSVLKMLRVEVRVMAVDHVCSILSLTHAGASASSVSHHQRLACSGRRD